MRNIKCATVLAFVISVSIFAACAQATTTQSVLRGEAFTEHDSVLVVAENSQKLFDWQSSKPLIPASLTKLVTAELAIQKWGLAYRFKTDFYYQDKVLWVKGYGDPMLVSEELDVLVKRLNSELAKRQVSAIHIDNSYFKFGSVPGRSVGSAAVVDPYNAPLSAVAANFNTVNLRRRNKVVESAEPQTPLTDTANRLSSVVKGNASERVNLVNADNAQQHFAEVLAIKLAAGGQINRNIQIAINQTVPDDADLVYRHANTHTLKQVLRGALEFSNNFTANQVFLKLADQVDAATVVARPAPVSFVGALTFADKQIAKRYGWRDYAFVEGAGLSRANRVSAEQIDDILQALAPHKSLLKNIKTSTPTASVYAKTGTLDGVRSYAGFIEVKQQRYRFVFMFNRKLPWKYRDTLLARLVDDLSKL